MGFLSGMLGAVVKTALTPVAVIKDVANIVTDEEPNATGDLLGSACDDVSDAFDDLGDGDLL